MSSDQTRCAWAIFDAHEVEKNGKMEKVPAVICGDPGSVLATLDLDGKIEKMWVCLPHLGALIHHGKVVSPLPRADGKFHLAEGEVACAHTTNCKEPIGGIHGAHVVREGMTGRHLIVCKAHYDLRTGVGRPVGSRMTASFFGGLPGLTGSPPPFTVNGGS